MCSGTGRWIAQRSPQAHGGNVVEPVGDVAHAGILRDLPRLALLDLDLEELVALVREEEVVVRVRFLFDLASYLEAQVQPIPFILKGTSVYC